MPLEESFDIKCHFVYNGCRVANLVRSYQLLCRNGHFSIELSDNSRTRPFFSLTAFDNYLKNTGRHFENKHFTTWGEQFQCVRCSCLRLPSLGRPRSAGNSIAVSFLNAQCKKCPGRVALHTNVGKLISGRSE